MRYVLLAQSPPSQSLNTAPQVGVSVELLVILLGTILSNAFGWVATRAVASADKRIDQNSKIIAALEAKHYDLEKKIAEQYVPRPEFTHRLSLIDAHIETLGTRVQEQTVILKSIEVTITERFRDS